MLFLKSIYQFTTFKVIPPEFMDKGLKYLGLKEETFEKSEEDKEESASGKRRLEEKDDLTNIELVGYTKDSGMLENLNSFLLAGVGCAIVILCIVAAKVIERSLSKEKRGKIAKFGRKLVALIYNGTHQTINNGAIPLQVTSFFGLKQCITSNSSWTSYCGPLSILSFMLAYPILTYLYLLKNKERLDNPNEKYFHEKHRTVFGSLRYYREERMGLGFILFIHYRRLFYSFIIVFVQEISSVQI